MGQEKEGGIEREDERKEAKRKREKSHDDVRCEKATGTCEEMF